MTTPYTQTLLSALNAQAGEKHNPATTTTQELISQEHTNPTSSVRLLLRMLVRDAMQYRETLRAERERCQRIHTESPTMTPRLTLLASRLITLLKQNSVQFSCSPQNWASIDQAIKDTEAELKNLNTLSASTPCADTSKPRQGTQDEIIYLAAPYTHPDPDIRAQRAHTITRIAAGLATQGHTVFSPITHGAGLQQHLPPYIELDHEFWMQQCLPLVRACTRILIIPLDGWTDSAGIKREVEEALAHGKPVGMLTDHEITQLQA